MAERFGGKYSPGGARGTRPAEDAREDARARRAIEGAGRKAAILYLPAAILAITAFGDGPEELVISLVGALCLGLAAWMLAEGLKAEAAYKARTIARRPALPRKMLATVLTGAGVFLAAWTGDNGVVGSALYALAAAGLHVAAFGIDPLRDKRMEGVDQFQQDRVARVVDRAEETLAAMRDHIRRTDARALHDRVDAFAATARRMIRTVEEDPRDLTSARKFLGVYLEGARDATIKFADLWTRKKDPEARAAYEALLDDLEQNFAARTERMLEGDRTDMDIEIKVLRDRLDREGV